jgi:hypothetical protein
MFGLENDLTLAHDQCYPESTRGMCCSADGTTVKPGTRSARSSTARAACQHLQAVSGLQRRPMSLNIVVAGAKSSRPKEIVICFCGHQEAPGAGFIEQHKRDVAIAGRTCALA